MPGTTTANPTPLFFVYALESEKDGNRYIGYSTDIFRRFKEHNDGLSFPTKYRRPLKLIYYEACAHMEDAKRREGYLKTTGGRRFLAKRLREYYSQL